MRESIGARIRSVRTSRGVDRKTLAEMAGCTPQYLAEIESGGRDPSLSLLRRLALGLRVPAGELLGGVDGDQDRLEAYLADVGNWSGDEAHSLKRDIEALVRLYQARQGGLRGTGD
ncbi:MAG: helix-turn-helix transcriptional regulator [Bacillota bacterium]|nr:helix-turn-helix transcriptional regulator [Bacillota bacterium]